MPKKNKLVYQSEESFEDSSLETKLKKLKKRLKDCQKEKEEYLTGWQRASADLVNFRRRQEENQNNAKIQNKAAVIKEILPVLDSLDQVTGDKNIIAIQQQLTTILQAQGLKQIKAKGEKFDPHLHEAIEQVKISGKSGTIAEEVQKGYLLNGQVLRPAKVKVAK